MKEDKVLWMEGMFLRPHHFQHADAWQQALIRQSRQGAYHWGFSRLELDIGMQSLGKIALVSASGVLPDGTYFDVDSVDELPPPIDVDDSWQEMIIVLALPAARAGRQSAILTESSGSTARYLAFEKQVIDDNDLSAGSATLCCARLRLRLMPMSALTADWIGMGVVQLKRKDLDGGVCLEEGYIPPLLNVHAHRTVHRMMQEMAGLLRQCRQRLCRHMNGQDNARAVPVRDMLLLGLVSRFSARTEHALHLPCLHPHILFAEWLGAAMELSAFRPPYAADMEIPQYDHQLAAEGFSRLMALLRQGLSLMLEENALPLPLVKRMPGLSIATLPERAMIAGFDFILRINTEGENGEGVDEVLRQLKIAPLNRIRDLVQLQLPGVALKPLDRVPPSLPYRSGDRYQLLESGGEFWQEISDTGIFAFYLAHDSASVTVELWAVRQSTLQDIPAS